MMKKIIVCLYFLCMCAKPLFAEKVSSNVADGLDLPTPPATKPLSPSLSHGMFETMEPDSEPKIIPLVNNKNSAHPDLLNKVKNEEENAKLVSFYFQDASLSLVADYIAKLHNVTFLPDDAVKPLMQGGGTLEGHKVSFKTNKLFTKAQTWDIFTRLLDIAGLSLIKDPAGAKDTSDALYRIVSVASANKEVIPFYFDTDIDKMPENAEKVHYCYVAKTTLLVTLQSVATALASTTAKINTVPELNVLMITDKALNVRSLMHVIEEFDKDMPEAMSIIKLVRTDATTVMNLYANLVKAESANSARVAGQRTQPKSSYFPMNVRVLAEPRTNSLILLGQQKALKKVEDFIVSHIDVELDLPYSPLHICELDHAKSDDIAAVLQKLVAFGQGTTAAQYGGTLDGQKYFQAVQITSEPTGNRLIIKAEEEDYNKLHAIIKELDVDQPQLAIEVLIVDISSQDNKELGVQWRNRSDGSVIKNTNMQFAGLNGTVTNPVGTGNLLGNLIGLATGGANPAGTTLVSLGNAVDNVWGLLRALRTYTHTRIIENPFLLATNKYQASFSFGSTRRVKTATVAGNTSSVGDVSASLQIQIAPQINSQGQINMQVVIDITDFTDETDGSNGNTTTKHISTNVSVSNNEIIALGGITRNKVVRSHVKVPLLGDLPLLGNLFKTRTKLNIKSNLVVFIAPRIISPTLESHMNYYTTKKVDETKGMMEGMLDPATSRDPISSVFFGDRTESSLEAMNAFFQEDAPGKMKKSRKKAQDLRIGSQQKSTRKRRLKHKEVV